MYLLGAFGLRKPPGVEPNEVGPVDGEGPGGFMVGEGWKGWNGVEDEVGVPPNEGGTTAVGCMKEGGCFVMFGGL